MSITLSSVQYTYMPHTPFERIAIQDIDLEIKKGEFVAIIGHTGSGKSTLVQHLNGLLKPSQGKVCIDGVDINQNTLEAKQIKRKIGMVFQYPEHQLFEETIYDDIAFGPRNLGLPEEEVEERVQEAMAFVNLEYETYKGRSPFQLSGGQMRRAAIAGIIALRPEYLILDEPSAGLDPCGRDYIFQKVMELYEKTGIAVVLVSHNMDDVASLAGRILVMNHGRISVDAAPSEAFSKMQELKQAGVDVPQLTKLLCLLKEKGMPVNTQNLDTETAVKDILAVLRR